MMTDSHLRNSHSQITLTIVIMIKWQIQFAKKHTSEKKKSGSQIKITLDDHEQVASGFGT